MGLNPIKGRLGKHRFHPILVHFPSALYPFSLAMDLLGAFRDDQSFVAAGLYSLTGALGFSVFAMIYGLIDFLQLNAESKAWKVAGIHALLNASWFIVFLCLLFLRIKHPEFYAGWIYFTVMASATAGMIVSNYLGAELIYKHRVGIDDGP